MKLSTVAMHQAYRHWGIADGNDTTPIEVDALHESKMQEQRQRQGQREGQRQRQRKKQRKKQGQAEGRNIRHVDCEVFLLQGKEPHPKGLS